MDIQLIGEKKVKLTSKTGLIRNVISGKEYSEVITSPLNIHMFEDSSGDLYPSIVTIEEKIPDEVLEVFQKVLGMIMDIAVRHNAVEDLKAMENVNIENLFKLANEKGVTDTEMTALIGQVVMLKTDIEAKFRKSWYDIWNVYLKKYLMESLATRGE